MGSYFTKQRTHKQIDKNEIKFNPNTDIKLINIFENITNLNIGKVSGSDIWEKRKCRYQKIYNLSIIIINKIHNYESEYAKFSNQQECNEFSDFINESEFEVGENYGKLKLCSNDYDYRVNKKIQDEIFLSLQLIEEIVNCRDNILLKRVIDISKSL